MRSQFVVPEPGAKDGSQPEQVSTSKPNLQKVPFKKCGERDAERRLAVERGKRGQQNFIKELLNS